MDTVGNKVWSCDHHMMDQPLLIIADQSDCRLLPVCNYRGHLFLPQAARREIAMIKVVAPQMAQRVIDRAIQVVCTCTRAASYRVCGLGGRGRMGRVWMRGGGRKGRVWVRGGGRKGACAYTSVKLFSHTLSPSLPHHRPTVQWASLQTDRWRSSLLGQES